MRILQRKLELPYPQFRSGFRVPGWGRGMSKVAVIATIAVVPERRDDAVKILLRHRERCLRDEPGTLMFELLVPRDEADKVMLYEVYASQAAFQKHWHGESLAICNREGEGLLSIASGVWGTPAS